MEEYELKPKKANKCIIFMILIISMGTVPAIRLLAQDTKSVAESTVEIEFTEGNGEVPPLNPDDPNVPGNGGTDQSGPLVLNYVSHLTFAPQVISPVAQDYSSTTLKPYIQVTDVRGTGEGWEVYAQASNFEDEDQEITLKGASITFKDASTATPTESILGPDPEDPVILPADNNTKAKVAVADPNAGMGTWLIKWYNTPVDTENDSVVLNVPPGSGMLGRNTAKITWFITVGTVT